ncbi:MAG: sigma 54-interacting transcriptional regulator [Candidatus Hydrogenedentes bacterium]|nr:sigma 54-interacting transcriptional regulator [Candidatus Hydrogenedentota bacterium]
MVRVLVVEDEGVLRLTFKQFLRTEGFEVHMAENYEQAVAQLEAYAIDVVVTDIILEGKTGVDLLRSIKERGLAATVIMVTGEPNVESAAEAVRLGAFDYLAKPVTGRDLVRIVRLALDRRKLEEERNVYAARLEAFRRHLEAVFNSVNEGVITVDAQLRVLEYNQAFRRILHLSDRNLRGAPFAEALPPGLLPARSAIERTLASRTPVTDVRIETWIQGQGEKVLMISATPLVREDGAQSGAVLVVRDVTRLTMLEKELEDHQPLRDIVAKSRVMRDIFALVRNVSPTDSTVLICGESGTGKELVAEAVHQASARRDGPLVKVNCAALSEELLESELFGHVRGAFTTALSDRIGRFEAADGGTILLDEIGDISQRLQLRLLRVLQAREFERVGDSFPMHTDVRVIASTNQDLAQRIRAGQFREDLYFRLNVVRIDIPPLRERREDIPLLVDHFCRRFNAVFKKEITGVAPETMDVFMRYAWWGNVRELENCLERAFIVCHDTTILPRHLPREILAAGPAGPDAAAASLPVRARAIDAERLRGILDKTDWNVAKAARMLGVARNTLYNKMRAFQLIRPEDS